jgi:MoaA/NifB/PqqE/SkfB family radical SAM enzyme
MPILYIEVLKQCNLRCVMCGYPTDYPTRGKRLDTEQLKTILRDSLELDCKVVSFGGGEPFLRKDIETLIEYCGQLGLSLHINSNGTRFDDQSIGRLADADHLHLAFSLDHCIPALNDAIRGAGVFDSVKASVAGFLKLAPAVELTLNCVVGAHNLGTLDATVDMAASWGLRGIKFLPLHTNLGHNWKEEDLPENMAGKQDIAGRLGDELERAWTRAQALGLQTSSRAFLRGVPDYLNGTLDFPCYAGHLYGNIDPYGMLFPCYDYMGSLNVIERGLVDAWHSDEMQQLRDKVRHCKTPCWNSGNAEPSLRMDLKSTLRDPRQLVSDLEFYLL